MKNFEKYSSKDFVQDNYFIEWVTKSTPKHNEYWREVINQYPEKKEEIKIAFSVIKSFLPKSDEVQQTEIDDLWKMIENSTITKINFFRRYRYAVASVIILLVLTSTWWFYSTISRSNIEIDYTQINTSYENENEVKLILVDKSELKISDVESNLIYNPGGELTINSIKQLDQTVEDAADSKLLLNQIIVPYGKRSNIILSDGTKLWINSGSRAIYPIEFNAKKREIYVEGEVFLDVAKDYKKPFIVKTDKLDIKVLGTNFNISSYPDEQQVMVILVKGSIMIKPENNEEVMISPNQALVFSKQTQKASINYVDIYDYISWKDGWLRCTSEEIGSIINKLSRYYNKKFVFDDPLVKSMNMSGKLDLKENLEDVLKVISLTAPLEFNIENEIIYVRINNNNSTNVNN